MVLVELVLQRPLCQRLSARGVQPRDLPGMVLPTRIQLLPSQLGLLRSLRPHLFLLSPVSAQVLPSLRFLVGQSVLVFRMQSLRRLGLRHGG